MMSKLRLFGTVLVIALLLLSLGTAHPRRIRNTAEH